MDLQRTVQQHLQSWVPTGSRLLLAISGGPDSVALADSLRSLPFEVSWGHVDHRLRKGSTADAHFVQRLAAQWDIPCHVAKVHVRSFAAAHHLGLEEAAREARYDNLTKIALKLKCSYILTAHTANDQAETVLMNLLRGSGPTGLAGIPPRRKGAGGLWILRPLLEVSRQEIVQYLERHHLAHRQDPTNRQERFTRNRIRRQTLPTLEREFPGFAQRLVQLGDILREEENFWDGEVQIEFQKTVRKSGKKITVDLNRLLGYHKALGRRILRRALGAVSFPELEHAFELAVSSDGCSSQRVGDFQVVRKGQTLTAVPQSKDL